MKHWMLFFIVPRIDRHGGYEGQAVTLGLELQRRGVLLRILTDRPPINETCRQLTAANLFGLYRAFTNEFAAARRVGNAVVHVHALYRFSAVAIFAAQRQKLPVVLKLPSSIDVQTLFERPRLAVRCFRAFLQRVDRFVCPSRETTERLQNFLRHPQTAVCIPNGVDTNRFNPLTQRRHSRQQRVLLFVGRHVAIKGGDVLLRAFALARPQLPENTGLVMVGDGPERAAWEMLARQLDVSGRVDFAGDQARPEEFYQAADAFVLPSLNEGMPNTLLEAMACALPCLASDTGGARDVMVDNFAEQLFPVDDVATLAKKLPSLLDSKIGAAMRQHVETHYSIPVIAQRYLDLYEDLMS
jgi:glycosyltransferase involved in cell wall biosynthesis